MNPFAETAHAAVSTAAFSSVVDPIISNIVDPVVELMFAIAILVFAYGIFEMVWKGNDPSVREAGRNHMLGGIIGMFIMLSAWGIINLVANTVSGF